MEKAKPMAASKPTKPKVQKLPKRNCDRKLARSLASAFCLYAAELEVDKPVINWGVDDYMRFLGWLFQKTNKRD